MRIARIHVGAELVVGAEIALGKPQSHYLTHVLRLKSGAAMFLFNGWEALDYHATLVLDGKQAKAVIDAAIPLNTETELDCEVIQGMGRSDHMDWMIQKTTELGVTKISIFNSGRTQSPLKTAQLEKKLAHWRSVTISACEQCGRTFLPGLSFHANLEQAIAASSSDLKLLLDFDGAAIASVLQPSQQAISLLLGPEGGLNKPEIGLAKSAGFVPVKLGPRVLRTETAATAALAIVQSALGDL